MNSQTIHAKSQSRKDSFIDQPRRFSLAPLRLCVMLFLGILVVQTTFAQEVADIIKVRTRVVFMDALVKDKHTGSNISDLSADNFEVLDDGQPRKISYFTREGQARKPLALILILDLRDDGAGRFLKREEVRKAMLDELAKLPEGDEVAILAINLNSVDDKTAAIRNGKAMWLTEFTRDPAQLEAALARVPALVAPAPETDKTKHDEKDPARESSGSLSVSTDRTATEPKDSSEATKKK